MAMKYIRCEFPEPTRSGIETCDGMLLYFEMGEDQGAVRQIEIFDDGEVLFCDRDHHTDEYGSLAKGILEPLDSEYPYPVGYVEAALL